MGQAACGEPRDDKGSFIFHKEVVTPYLTRGKLERDSVDQEVGHPHSQDRMALDR